MFPRWQRCRLRFPSCGLLLTFRWWPPARSHCLTTRKTTIRGTLSCQPRTAPVKIFYFRHSTFISLRLHILSLFQSESGIHIKHSLHAQYVLLIIHVPLTLLRRKHPSKAESVYIVRFPWQHTSKSILCQAHSEASVAKRFTLLRIKVRLYYWFLKKKSVCRPPRKPIFCLNFLTYA